MARPKKGEGKASDKKVAKTAANLGFEARMWAAADTLRGSMDASEYKHVVLGLIFLKYISDSFEELHTALKEGKGSQVGPTVRRHRGNPGNRTRHDGGDHPLIRVPGLHRRKVQKHGALKRTQTPARGKAERQGLPRPPAVLPLPASPAPARNAHPKAPPP